jgi:hypothetical protein
VQDGLADVSRPFWLWSVAKPGIEGKILALAPQPWRSVEATDVFTSLSTSGVARRGKRERRWQ